jgi:hypothetical protein
MYWDKLLQEVAAVGVLELHLQQDHCLLELAQQDIRHYLLRQHCLLLVAGVHRRQQDNWALQLVNSLQLDTQNSLHMR